MSARIALGALAVFLLLTVAACGGGGSAKPTPSPTAVASPRPAREAQFQIAYVDNDKRDIWVVPADGIGPRNITAGGCPQTYQLFWSPAASRIACISSRFDGQAKKQVLVFALEGHLLFDLSRDASFAGFSWPGMAGSSPSSLWSATGQYLAYAWRRKT
jgi:hypothetical protein